MLDGIGKVLRECPPDLVADLADRGIVMVGGSALLPGFDQMLREATGMPVHIAERPDVCAAQGLGAMLEGHIKPLVLNPLAALSRDAPAAPPASTPQIAPDGRALPPRCASAPGRPAD